MSENKPQNIDDGLEVTYRIPVERFQYADELSAENRKHYIILFGDTAAGMISIDLPREEAPPGTYEIFGLYILPEYTGMGIGTEAVSFAAEQIRRMGYRQISLWVLEPNIPARKFYEKLGFRPDGTEKLSYYDRPIHLIRYIREIRS